jgi:hypothetical protein
MKKYYFIFYWRRSVSSTSNPGEWEPVNAAIDIHPLSWEAKNGGKTWNGGSSYENVLQNWIEITEEEYIEF